MALSVDFETRPETSADFDFDVTRGIIPGVSEFTKFGRGDVDTTVTDIWSGAASISNVWVAPTQARIHAIVSTSTSDASAGIGARTIRVFGLVDWDTKEVNEDITMNGTTPVNTSNSYVIIHRMAVLTNGGTNINVGTISATAATDGTVTAEIAISQGQTQMAIMGIPSVQTLLLHEFHASINDGNAQSVIDIQVRVNTDPGTEITNFINKHDIEIQNSGTSYGIHIFRPPPADPGPSIIKIQGIASGANISCSAGFEGYLVDN